MFGLIVQSSTKGPVVRSRSTSAVRTSSSDVAFADLWQVCGWLVGLPGLVLSYYAAITYIPTIRRSLAEGRRARTT